MPFDLKKQLSLFGLINNKNPLIINSTDKTIKLITQFVNASFYLEKPIIYLINLRLYNGIFFVVI